MKPLSTKIRSMNRLAQPRARSASSDNLIAALFAASLLMMAPLTHAATSCKIDSVSGLNFGSYDPFASTALDIATTASITCTSNSNNNAVVTVAISLGTGSAGSYIPTRKMQGPGDTLNYNLYLDAAHNQILGDGTGGTSQDSGSATISKTSPFTFIETIYGRIFAGQDPAVGAYSDSIVYTMNF